MIFSIIILSVTIFILFFIIYKNNHKEHFDDIVKDNCPPNYTPVKNIKYNRELKNPLFGISGNELQDIFDSIVKKNQSKFTPQNMIKIEKQQYDYYSGLTDLYIVNYDELVVYINKIINTINNRISIDDINSGYFILNNYYLQKIYKNENNDKRYIVIFEIYQENKLLLMSIELDMYVYVNSNSHSDFKINRLILKSLTSKEHLDKISGYQSDFDKNVSINRNYPEINSFDPQKYYMDNDKDTIVIPTKYTKKRGKNTNIFRCFNNKSKIVFNQIENRNICQSKNNGIGQKTETGVWDRNCSDDKECPFYKSNKNYKNNFGGCIKGRCQLPINMVSVSPHFYDETKKPLCYNCIGESNNCCEDQKDKSKYPRLASPDYAFQGDQNIRISQEKELLEKGIYNKHLK